MIGQRLEIHHSGTPVQRPLRKLQVIQRGAVNIKFCVSSVENCHCFMIISRKVVVFMNIHVIPYCY